LRTRLIKALIGLGVAFIFCFFFAKQIYNVLVWHHPCAFPAPGMPEPPRAARGTRGTA
jgi:sec-independent protein translocase protein TatC